MRKANRAVLVEGYMDVIGVYAAGIKEVVASCGTALTILKSGHYIGTPIRWWLISILTTPGPTRPSVPYSCCSMKVCT